MWPISSSSCEASSHRWPALQALIAAVQATAFTLSELRSAARRSSTARSQPSALAQAEVAAPRVTCVVYLCIFTMLFHMYE